MRLLTSWILGKIFGKDLTKNKLNWKFLAEKILNLEITQSIKILINACTILSQLTLVMFHNAYNYLVRF